MTLGITVREIPSEEDREAILAPLQSYNISRAGDQRLQPVAIMLTDAAGRSVGGLWGKCGYDWLVVEYLAVPEEHRGADLGTGLMAKAEDVARANGCVGLWLDTYSFQARGFYEKLGFQVFGELKDQPPGASRFFLSKRLRPSHEASP